MNIEKKTFNSILQLNNGAEFEVVESMETIQILLTDNL